MRYNITELQERKVNNDKWLARLQRKISACDERLKELRDLQPVLEKACRKEAKESEEAIRRSERGGLIGHFYRKRVAKEFAESQEANEIYLSAGAEYDSVVSERKTASDNLKEAVRRDKEIQKTFRYLVRVIGKTETPEGEELRDIAQRKKQLAAESRRYSVFLEAGSAVIRENGLIDEQIMRTIRETKGMSRDFLIGQIPEIAASVRESTRLLLKSINGFTEKAKAFEWYHSETEELFKQQTRRIAEALKEFEEGLSGTKAQNPEWVRGALFRIRNEGDEMGTLVLAAVNKARNILATVQEELKGTAGREEEAILSGRQVWEIEETK